MVHVRPLVNVDRLNLMPHLAIVMPQQDTDGVLFDVEIVEGHAVNVALTGLAR